MQNEIDWSFGFLW